MKYRKTRRIDPNICSMVSIILGSSCFFFFLLLVACMPTQTSAFIARRTGCYHNGTWYADKSYIPTEEKCLNCECKSRNLVCRLKVCPEIPLPPPRGCVVVQKRNTCCPYLSCARLELFERIPATRRIIAYLDHYERESIDRVVNDNMLQRRSDDSDIDFYVCVKNGTVYKSGSAMSSSNLCTYCYCIGGQEKCVKPKCMLPLEGCRPIFVDATCCPVRYDCNPKTSGKSSQEIIHTKISNKHFLRMSQRLQRNRGCTVGKQFYVEGQKMKSDADKPCDVCFCIRGNRRCAPKKCAPALKNCLPVVPKGQCCPSSYDCDHQRDYRRADNSRQFNLFNLFFNDDLETAPQNTTIPAEYPHDRNPALVAAERYNVTEQNDESLMDKIRHGLEFIDTNQETEKLPIEAPVNKEELSLLDLLLEPETDITLDDAIKEDMAEKTTMTSWLDILLGKDEDENSEQKSSVTEYPDMSTTTEVREITTMETESSAETTAEPTTTIEPNNNDERIQLKMGDIFERNNLTTTTTTAPIKRTEKIFVKMASTTMTPIKITTTTTTKLPTTTTIKSVTNTSSTTAATTTTQKTNGFLNAIFDGISGILSTDKAQNNTVKQESMNNKTIITTTTTIKTTTIKTTTMKPTIKNVTVSTQKPLPAFKPIPTTKTHTRINSKIANLTLNPNYLLQKPPERNSTQAYKTQSTTPSPTTKVKPATVKPLPIKTILEAEESYIEPTLPPSLPNLKIIPFLPTDAVKADRNKPTNYENYYNKSPIDKIDYDIYEDPNMYPLLTERFPTYMNDENKAEYIYKFNIEGPPVSTINIQGFSPPTKTEGGFVPKEPIINNEDQLANDYQYIIDITTANPLENTTKPIIDITTSNIYNNVIRTEPPPNLISLMQEQLINGPGEQNIVNTTDVLNATSNALDTYAFLLQKIIPTTNNTNIITTTTTSAPTLHPFKTLSTTIPTIKYTPSLRPTETTVVTSMPATKVLHKTTTPKSSNRKVTKPQTSTTSTPAPSVISTTAAAVFQSPFDKLPFMNASFNIKTNDRKTTVKSSSTTYKKLLHTTTVATITESSTATRFDPLGALKLAGCNIYGRMYRVNRVIVELSNECRECKCTEIGVECKRLDC